MKKLFTNLRKNSENNKGFSLVELIIVIAIMVALVAMLAPQFVKYVQKSRDAVVKSSAEDVLAVAKSEFALGNLKIAAEKTEGKITVKTNESGHIRVLLEDLVYAEGEGDTDEKRFGNMCGLDENKTSASDKVYIITIRGETNTFNTQETVGTFTEKVTDGGHTGD